ncbi:MAG: LPS export ABC transporter ATP-binding protein [Candidatus Contendobacter sp.]|jgi:lipopolysaccharide export system ATP-binding protein|nr:LPS export ABC transporter ATP-binding protein [Gammaproteobacteria bacterium]MCC8993174.1 LPS export ABC transporter ATP-binding protein [Candidatus Contendobacter sp.]
MAQLIAKEIVKHYRKRTVVDAASLTVASGEVVGLLGPNGAGKTTCFYMMVGLIHCDEGRVLLDDRDLTHLPMHARARLGVSYLPQEPSVFRKLSVLDNVLAILETRRDLAKADRRPLAEELLHELHVGHLHDSLGISLSGGERRRVEIARALAANPAFILLDEPFAGVDPLSVLDIQRIIAHLCERRIGVLITDHNVRETLGICQRAYILNEGRVIAEGDPAAILANQQVRQVYLGESFQL